MKDPMYSTADMGVCVLFILEAVGAVPLLPECGIVYAIG